MPDRDDLDTLLDSALATYADPGPDSGLEQQVLASLAAAQEPREPRRLFASTWSWLPWAIAAPLVASLLLWIALSRIPHVPSREAEQAQGTAAHAPITTTQPDAKHEKHPSAMKPEQAGAQRPARRKPCPFKAEGSGPCSAGAREVAKVAPLPKLDVFPTPRPLTGEEKALVTMVYGGSKAERDAVAAPPAQSDAPLDIAALNVPPLASSGEGKN